MSLPPLVEPADSLTKQEVERYSRHLIIPDVGMAGQKRLKNAKVLVVGAGGLGSPALLYLAAAGVGTLGILDFDIVDESNLQRQVIHGQSDIGKSKARLGQGVDRRDQPTGHGEPAHRAAGFVQCAGHLRRLRPDPGRHRQLRHPLPGQRCLRAAGQAVRVGLDLPVRGPGQRVLGRVRPAVPRPLPRAAATGHGALLRGGRRTRRAVRVHRLDHGHRGDQADHRNRRAAARPADGVRRPGDELPHGQGPQGPGGHADRGPHRLRGVLRRGVRGRGRSGGRPHHLRPRPQGQDGCRRELPAGRRPGAERVRDRLDPRARC